MKPKDEARDWLDKRCGQGVHVETHFVNGTAGPLTNKGLLSKRRTRRPEVTRVVEDEVAVLDLYHVGTVSYNLADLPEDIEVCIQSEPAEQLEMTFDDGTSLLITMRITVTEEG